jgi:glycyl-tRNA synthetase
LLDVEQRRQTIVREAEALAAGIGGTIPNDPGLLAEVTNLVERPTPLLGEFERRFLELPAEVLVAVMRKHQRYFPLYHQKHGRLLPYFIAVRNGDSEHLDMVADGNEHVIRARFADASFFYNKDRQHKLTDRLPALDKLTFQADLGSMLDKTHRLEKLTSSIAGMLGLGEEEQATAARAATLAKADLATSMVVEMTSLQGIMGGHYARLSGEPEAVVAAIAEQYEAVSQTRPGLALALADRLDSLVGLFSVGLSPKGSNDPYAIRRAALQVVQNLLGNQVSFDLRPALVAAADLLPVSWEPKVLDEVSGFIGGRLEAVLREEGYSASVVKAVLAEQMHDPYAAARAAADLTAAIAAEDWTDLLNAYARCARITRPLKEQYPLHPQNFALPEEQELLDAYQSVATITGGSVPALVGALRRMQPAISRFFDQVLVMDEDTAVRENRLALLQAITRLARGTADLAHLEGF